MAKKPSASYEEKPKAARKKTTKKPDPAVDTLGQTHEDANSQQTKTPEDTSSNIKESTMTEQAQATTEVKKIKFCEKSVEGGIAKFAFGNGEVLTIDLNELPEDVQTDLRDHGALQKIGDAYASAGGDYAFATASASKVMQNLRDGLFNAARGTGGAGAQKTGELATALAALQGRDVGEVTLALEAASDEQKKALRAHPQIKAKIAELRAIKAAEALAKAGAVAELPSF